MKLLAATLVASLAVVVGPTAGPALACRPVATVPNPCGPYMPPPPPPGVKGHLYQLHHLQQLEHLNAWHR